MEFECTSFDILFDENWILGDVPTIFQVIQKCFKISDIEKEILQAIKLSFDIGLKYFSKEDLEAQIFRHACLAAEKVLTKKLKFLENFKGNVNSFDGVDPSPKLIQLLNVCIEIISCHKGIFEHCHDNQVTFLQAGCLLLNFTKMLNYCFHHCKISEILYGSHFMTVAGSLSNLFKICCEYLDKLLHFLTEKSFYELGDSETTILSETLSQLSKSGVILISLDVKVMAKIWKAYIFLIEKYSSCLRGCYDISESFNALCLNIITRVEIIISKDQCDMEDSKTVKLACFCLKLVIKFCEVFSEHLQGCYESLLNVLLTLCRCHESMKINHPNQTLINQLSIGIDSLLSQLMGDEEFIKHCELTSKNWMNIQSTSAGFLILCCLIVKKLMHSDTDTRRLWFYENNNVLLWIFQFLSSGEYLFFLHHQLESFSVKKPKKYPYLYEYVFVSTSAFLLTISSTEFVIVENILIKNVLQSHPLCAIFAVDLWCLLARFADSKLCFNQIFKLSEIFQQLESERIEKCYLASLISRVFPLLTQNQKDVFLKSFPKSFYSELWRKLFVANEDNNFSSCTMQNINQSVLEIDKCIQGEEMISQFDETERSLPEEVNSRIGKFWKFNYFKLSKTYQLPQFFKLICSITACLIQYITSENLLMILNQVKKLVLVEEISFEDIIKLYITEILNSLSTVVIPHDKFQILIIETIAGIFQQLLSSKKSILKQRTLEIFYNFSHVTKHAEVISLSGRKSSVLTEEMTNYFQKKTSEDLSFDVNNYVRGLFQTKYHHHCKGFDLTSNKPKLNNLTNVQDITDMWKEMTKKIFDNPLLFSDFQKKEIVNICGSLISLLNDTNN